MRDDWLPHFSDFTHLPTTIISYESFFYMDKKKCITQQQFWALGVLLLFLFPIIWHAKIKAVWPFFWRGHVAFREDNLQTTRSPLTLVLHCGLLPILYLAEAKREYGPWMAFLLFLYDRHIFQVQQQARDYLRPLREVTRVLTDFDTLNLWHSYLERERGGGVK